MRNLEFIYNRIEHCVLLDLLKSKDINQSLAYMVDFKEYKNLTIVPKTYSIEVSNDNITMIIILLIGFEKEEYKELEEKVNVHLICFNNAYKLINEFKKFRNKIKHIEFMSLFYMQLSRTKSKKLHDSIALLNLNSGNFYPPTIK